MNFAALALTALLLIPDAAQAGGDISIYTAAKGHTCKLISQDRETGDRITRCPGVAGYSLLLLESDDRASITVQDSEGGAIPLNFWDIVSPTLSSLGDRIEWRMEEGRAGRKPHAFIVRLYSVDQSDVAKPKPKEFLVTARLKDGQACVTGAIPANQPGANGEARKLADDRKSQCLPPIKASN